MAIDKRELAEKIAKNAFYGKTDLGGKPYVNHLYRVAEEAMEWTKHDDLYCAAFLHDILEDCPEWTPKAIEQLFGNSVMETVVLLTYSGGDYMSYIRSIRDSGNGFAKAIKKADLKDNMNLLWLPTISDADLQRVKQYHNAYRALEGK